MRNIIILTIVCCLVISCSTINTNTINKTNEEYTIKDFCINGFGFSYNLVEIRSMKQFIKNHGKPIRITNSSYTNKHDGIKDIKTILKYPNYEICYLNYAKRTKWEPPESLLMYIESTNNGKYRNNVYIGSSKEVVRENLNTGIIKNNKYEYMNDDGNIVTILFENGKAVRIIWEYGRE
jgi:hypothetical protein